MRCKRLARKYEDINNTATCSINIGSWNNNILFQTIKKKSNTEFTNIILDILFLITVLWFWLLLFNN